MNLVLNETDADAILNVDVTLQKNHYHDAYGSSSGVMDPILDVAIFEIIRIKQGTTTYVSKH